MDFVTFLKVVEQELTAISNGYWGDVFLITQDVDGNVQIDINGAKADFPGKEQLPNLPELNFLLKNELIYINNGGWSTPKLTLTNTLVTFELGYLKVEMCSKPAS